MFEGCCMEIKSITYGLNNNWYVTFDNEEATKQAFLHLKNCEKSVNNRPIHVRKISSEIKKVEFLNLCLNFILKLYF